MPARKSSKKRKAQKYPSEADGDNMDKRESKSKKHDPRDKNAGGQKLVRKFVAGLATRLSGHEKGDMESIFLAALSALPEGKLKAELSRDTATAIQLLTAQLTTTVINEHQHPLVHTQAPTVCQGDDGRMSPAPKESQGATAVPCTLELYNRARREAEKKYLKNNPAGSTEAPAGDSKGGGLLRTLALNPRAPLDLLVDAVSSEPYAGRSSEPASFTGGTLQ
ncbi:unnamed protein product, partial [Sphacelaria rigidula]